MAYEFRLPDLGEGIAEVELRRWLVRVGDRIAEHQGVVEVESDKAVVEIPSPRAGVVAALHRAEGETVPVGAPLITIAEETAAAEPRRDSAGIVGVLPEEEPAPAAALASPMVRRLARERGLDLAGIRGSGPRGSITPEDLERGAPEQQAPQGFGPVELVPLKGMRRTIARNVLASRQITASVTTMEEVDLTELWELRNREQPEVETHGSHLTFLPFFIKAAQHALKDHPLFNAAIDDAAGQIVVKKHYHFGIAVATPEGLMVPVIRDVDRKSVLELAAEIETLGKKARERSITREELQGSSFSITNYGHYGGTFATPIINWPDVAILGCGRIGERPWVHRGAIAVRKILPLSLTFDHRVTDGADAAHFIARIARFLEDPALLFIDCA